MKITTHVQLSTLAAMLTLSNADLRNFNSHRNLSTSYEGNVNTVCRVDDGWFLGGPDDPNRKDHYETRLKLSLEECKDKCTRKSWCKGVEYGKPRNKSSYCELWKTEIGSMMPAGSSGRGGCYRKVDDSSSSTNAYNRGWREARDLWDSMGFDTDTCTINEVRNDFNPEVKDVVYDECERRYTYNRDFEDECRDGADEYVAKMHRECTGYADCAGVGEGFAQDIVDDFCDPIYKEYKFDIDSDSIFPEGCEDDAIRECEGEVGYLVNDYAQAGDCGSYNDWFDVPNWKRRGLLAECEEIIEEYYENAGLR